MAWPAPLSMGKAEAQGRPPRQLTHPAPPHPAGLWLRWCCCCCPGLVSGFHAWRAASLRYKALALIQDNESSWGRGRPCLGPASLTLPPPAPRTPCGLCGLTLLDLGKNDNPRAGQGLASSVFIKNTFFRRAPKEHRPDVFFRPLIWATG